MGSLGGGPEDEGSSVGEEELDSIQMKGQGRRKAAERRVRWSLVHNFFEEPF